MLKKTNFKRSRNHLEGFTHDLQNNPPKVPGAMCVKCKQCAKVLFSSDITENNFICPHCNHHFRLSARQRLALVCDTDSFTEWDTSLQAVDILNFPGYASKLRSSRLQSREKDAVITGRATIGGLECAVFAMEAGFMMGSMGSVVGEKVTRCFEQATQLELPVIGFTVSGGARMQEGLISLMQMAKTSGAVQYHNQAGLLYITVLTDPTTGGVTASFAMEGDILLAEPGTLIAFAGPRVIEQTMRTKLPKGFQRAEFLLEKGFIDAVVPRTELKDTLATLLSIHGAKPPVAENAEQVESPPIVSSTPTAKKPGANKTKNAANKTKNTPQEDA